MGHFDDAVEDRLARVSPPTLEPSGDEEHDKLTGEVHGLDALAPERNAIFAEADAEALDDEEHSD